MSRNPFHFIAPCNVTFPPKTNSKTHLNVLKYVKRKNVIDILHMPLASFIQCQQFKPQGAAAEFTETEGLTTGVSKNLHVTFT